ncbi:di-heme oxidoredictase family protein [Pseudobacteriovorax antillogorgiicola]|uniref:CxxC motif-containing protein, DUF1111 family n=1 Tax=Pseudobacteriovorax antillogorgiicola TaxID=1513793 RepID=A0A1Y6BR30_9BACT|nr:di-heme oxidoredictase family protein [Pseudobacteriovorax antillogorgiicola]TCS53741.1 CxxC motif-containing protein (DUF1111 family) [Pseudobacteriovorax antillogorgiicola]SMF22667.1 CxxC motif-containing protein, DUF1111 family [Pseudobacteriovorax antillogorgiicola]
MNDKLCRISLIGSSLLFLAATLSCSNLQAPDAPISLRENDPRPQPNDTTMDSADSVDQRIPPKMPEGPAMMEGGELTFMPFEKDFNKIGKRISGFLNGDGVAITEGVVRVRRRHENDMDFAKFNPFYWEGRTTRFRVEDFTPVGQKLIRFTLLTEWPQDYERDRGPDFSAIYVGDPLANETLRSKFKINNRMAHVKDNRHFSFELSGELFERYQEDLEAGQLLTFEYRFFNDEQFPNWAEQKTVNPHNLSAYYSEFFRIKIGEPGLFIDNFQARGEFPEAWRYAGGWTTTPTTRVEPWNSLQQQAFNLTHDRAAEFLMGRTWFHTDFISGQHIADPSDDKPSVFRPAMQEDRSAYAGSSYNMTSCNGCHQHNAGFLLPAAGQAIHGTVAKTLDPQTGRSHRVYGNQLQTDGPQKEGNLVISRFETKIVTLDDGTEVELSKPVFVIESGKSRAPVALSVRRPLSLIGMGLINAIPAQEIERLDQLSAGRAGKVAGKTARFGWKANQVDLAAQIRTALKHDMGVTTIEENLLDCSGNCQTGKGHLPKEAIEGMESYMSLLGVPPRTNPEDPQVRQGEKIFKLLGCESCHAPYWRTGTSRFAELSEQYIHPYTDLLLHDMGPGLADDHKGPQARLWRTAPLWGLKNTKYASAHHKDIFHPGDTNVTYEMTQAKVRTNRIELLHDGRAKSIMEAILWHDGEASDEVAAYKKLSADDRQALEAFLWDI